MRYSLFHVERDKATTLQSQIREMLVSAMLAGQLPAKAPVPSTRAMAGRLGVSRNTVMLAYQALATDGFLVSRERSGFYVAEDVRLAFPASPTARQASANSNAKAQTQHAEVDWEARFRLAPSRQPNITKPENWHDYKYPFIYGQVDSDLFPIGAWRDCMRQSMSLKWLDAWTDDRFAADDPMLVEQIRQRVLPRRGVMAQPDELLVTMGAQNALFLLNHLFVRDGARVAVEDPGYPDMRNMFALRGAELRPIPVDSSGMQVSALTDESLAFVTPSHQFPTSVTMTLDRRRELLDWAERADALIIEDDYEYEANYRGEPTPALKSLDQAGRVMHVGSLSKSMMPGLRMGFVVAPAPVIAELRAMRRLMLRHPPGNNQRVVALFLAQGGHDALIKRLHKVYLRRWEAMNLALADHFPGWSRSPAFGGSSFWLQGPDGFDARQLAADVEQYGVLIEPGDIFWSDPSSHASSFRLGFSSIPEDRIGEGISLLARAAQKQLDQLRITAEAS
ncbi:MAG: PLP-dependent aminotransferase family protein [Pseudomonadota bacterium]